MKLSVIIPTYDSRTTLEVLLESLVEQTHQDYEIIVVDDASTDDTAEAVARYDLRYERMTDNQGPAAARNRGVELSDGPWLVFTDADTVFEPDTLTTIEDIISSSDAAALFGTYAGRPANPESFLARYKALWEHYAIVMPFLNKGQRLHPMTTWVPRPGVVSREAFEAVGGFDTRFGGADLEDVEFGYRLHAAGFPIYFAEQLHIWHHYPTKLRRALRAFGRRAVLGVRMALRRRTMDPAGEGAPRQALVHICGFATVGLAVLSPLWPPLGLVAAGGFVGYTVLNRSFLSLAVREEGWGFALQSYGMCWLYTTVLGCGASWGLLTGLLGRR